MIRLLDIYQAHFQTTASVQLQYRFALLIWLIEAILEPLVYLIIWSNIARTSGTDISGYSAGDFVAYYIIYMIVNHITFTWIMWEFEYRIRSGSFSNQLLKPVHPIHGDIADNLTYKVLTSTVIWPAAIAFAYIFKPSFHFMLKTVLLFFPALFFAFLIRFLFEWTLSLLSFWTTRVNAVNQMYYTILLFFSGEIAPLSLLPKSMQQLSEFLPFRWMISFPIELALGKLPDHEIAAGLGFQLLWIGVGLLLLSSLWRFSVRRYAAVGS